MKSGGGLLGRVLIGEMVKGEVFERGVGMGEVNGCGLGGGV